MYNIDFVHRKGTLHKVPGALSRAWEGTYEIVVVASSTSEDPWYQEKLKNIERNPTRYPDWKVVHRLLYAHRPNKNIDPLIPDMDAWKLVLPAGDRDKVHKLVTWGGRKHLLEWLIIIIDRGIIETSIAR